MQIQNCMKKTVFAIPATATARETIGLLISHHIGLLPILDGNGRPIGVVGLRDLLDLALPPAIHLLEDVDFIEDFGAVETCQPSEEVLSQDRILIVVGGAIVFFFLHSLLHLTPSFVALTAAAIVLLVIRAPCMKSLKRLSGVSSSSLVRYLSWLAAWIKPAHWNAWCR